MKKLLMVLVAAVGLALAGGALAHGASGPAVAGHYTGGGGHHA